MSIPFITSEGVFTRWGHEIGGINEQNTARGTTFGNRITTIFSDYTTTDENLMNGIYTQQDNFRTTGDTLATYYQALIQATLIQMADDSAPLSPYTLSNAIDRLNADLLTAGSGIQAPVVSVTVASGSTNVGDAILISSVTNYDGTQLDYIFAETVNVTVTSDSQRGSTALQEPISYVGEIAVDVKAWNWPQGSGANVSANIINANSTTKITNGGFETWTAATVAPSNWTITGGVINVSVLRAASPVLYGNYSCQFLGDGATLQALQQTLSLSPWQVLPINLWIRLSAVPSNGTLRVRLIDGSNNVINDDQGVPNSFTKSLTSGVPTASWLAINQFFRTPKVLPSTVILEIAMTGTALDNAKSLYIDSIAMDNATPLYNGGPYCAAFSGGTPSAYLDNWVLTVANNKGVTSFARSLDRTLGLRDLQKRIRTGGGIPDNLIV